MNYENTPMQNRHLAVSNMGRYYAAMEVKKKRNEKAYKEFKRVPDYGTGKCKGVANE